MMNYPKLLPTQDQDAQDLGIWPQEEIDLPWPHIDASHTQTTVLTQRPRTSWPEEVLEGPASGFHLQPPDPSSVYSSHISSPLSNASGHPSEMVLLTSALQVPDPLSNYAQGSFPEEDLMFCDYQDLSGTSAQDGPEREYSQFLPIIYNLQDSSSNAPWNSVDMSRSLHSMPEDFTPAGWPIPLNEQLSNNMSQTTNNFPFNSQPIPQGVADQFRPISEGAVPMTLKDRKWEHMIVSDGSIQQLDNQPTFKSCKKKKGRRKGALSADTARKAREVRHNRACWRCWLLHTSVSK
jgi:hypothetical protein